MSKRLPTALFAACAIAVCAQPQPQRPSQPAVWLDPDKTEPPGTHYRTFTSRLAGGEVSYLVYLPPTYEKEPAARYPSVYWLHGLNGNQRAGAMFVEHAIQGGHHRAGLDSVAAGAHSQMHVGVGDGQVREEHVGHLDVIVLAGVHDDVLVTGPGECVGDRRQLDELGPGTHDRQDLHAVDLPDGVGVQR